MDEEAIPLPQACAAAADAAHNFVLLPAAAHAATAIAATAVADRAEARSHADALISGTAASTLRDSKFASYHDQVHMAAGQLDIWAQAEADLGTMEKGQAQEERLKAFLQKEFDFSYGLGHVAAINPVWDQSELERLLREFNQVRLLGGAVKGVRAAGGARECVLLGCKTLWPWLTVVPAAARCACCCHEGGRACCHWGKRTLLLAGEGHAA